MRLHRVATALTVLVFAAACDGPQSVLAPAGRDAEILARLFWWMLGGAVILWVALNGILFYVSRISQRAFPARLAEAFIIGGGIVFPTVVLGGLLAFALAEMPRQREFGEGLTVRITGESWWWRVEYLTDGATDFVVSANEVRLPAGARSEFKLASSGVIHSFWVPALGGKTDLIPGRETRMSLEPLEPGVYRGQCAEFCGESHALMALNAVVLAPDDFAAWLDREAGPMTLRDGGTEIAEAGRAVFLREGCGACHSIRGTPAAGNVGPDLTHLGGRTTLAAGVLPMNVAALERWIRSPEQVKPGARMPGYDHLDDTDLRALATFLEALE